jgi:hypothetical protein
LGASRGSARQAISVDADCAFPSLGHHGALQVLLPVPPSLSHATFHPIALYGVLSLARCRRNRACCLFTPSMHRHRSQERWERLPQAHQSRWPPPGQLKRPRSLAGLRGGLEIDEVFVEPAATRATSTGSRLASSAIFCRATNRMRKPRLSRYNLPFEGGALGIDEAHSPRLSHQALRRHDANALNAASG